MILKQAMDLIRSELEGKNTLFTYKSVLYMLLENLHITSEADMEGCLGYVTKDYSKAEFVIKYSDKITDPKTLKFVLLHEASHIVFEHFKIDVKNYDYKLLNFALDASINSYIIDKESENLVAPILNCVDGKGVSGVSDVYQHDSWESIYNIISAMPNELKNIFNENAEGLPSSSESARTDTNASESSSEANTNLSPFKDNHYKMFNNSSNSKKDGQLSEFDKALDEIIEHNMKKLLEECCEKVDIENDLKYGTTAGTIHLKFDKIEVMKSKSKWRKCLQQYLSGTKSERSTVRKTTWSRPNFRFGEHLPGKMRCSKQTVGVLVDVSGSMSANVLKAIEEIAEIGTFLRGIDHLILWDTALQGEYFNVTKNKFKNIEICGYGGTQLYYGLERLVKGIGDVLIVISDLCINDDDIKKLNEISQKKKLIIGVYGNEQVLINEHIKIVRIDEVK